MTWEYRLLIVTELGEATTLRTIAEFGLDGWELVTVARGMAWFKRPREVS